MGAWGRTAAARANKVPHRKPRIPALDEMVPACNWRLLLPPCCSPCRCSHPAAHPAAAPDAFTFEAWLSTTDFCHPSAIFSYALDSKAEVGRRTRRTAEEPLCAAALQLEPHLLLPQAQSPDLWPPRRAGPSLR